jgi:hypothetical protein
MRGDWFIRVASQGWIGYWRRIRGTKRRDLQCAWRFSPILPGSDPKEPPLPLSNSNHYESNLSLFLTEPGFQC